MTDPSPALDTLLTAWARAPAGDAATYARIVDRACAALPPRRFVDWPGWAAGAAMAATLVAVALSTPPVTVAPAPTPDDAAELAVVFTPTPEEEMLL